MLDKVLDLARYFLAQLPENALTLVAVAATFLGFWAIGRTVGKREGGEAALLGWALVYTVALLASVVGTGNLRWIAWLFLAAAVVCLYLSRRGLVPRRPFFGLLLPLGPVIVLALLMPLLHWDSYWHWVLNGSYSYRFDSFPVEPLDGFPSFHATYPQGSSLVYYFASFAAGRFLPSVGIFTNVVVTLIVMDCTARLLREITANAPPDSTARTGFFRDFGTPLVALLIVLPFNPSYQAVNFFSAIVDPMLGVIVFVTLVRWSSLASSPAPERPLAGDLFLLFMLGVLISGVKPSGWVLTFVLSAAAVFVGVVRRRPLLRWLLPTLAVLAGSLIANTVWQIYLSNFLDVGDQFSIQPFAEWRFDLIPALWGGIVDDLRLRYIYYPMVFLTIAAGLVALVRPGFIRNEKLAFMVSFVAIAMPLHWASLLAAYLGTGFAEVEIQRAASLHRYSTHVGFAVCATGWLVLLAEILPRAHAALRRVSARQAAGLTLAVYAVALGFVVLLPGVLMGAYFRKNFEDLRDTAVRIAATLPASDTVVVLGNEWGINFANYASWNPRAERRTAEMVNHKIVMYDADIAPGQQLLSEWMADPSVDHVWMFDAQPLNRLLRLPDAEAENLIWSRSTGTWRTVR